MILEAKAKAIFTYRSSLHRYQAYQQISNSYLVHRHRLVYKKQTANQGYSQVQN